MVYIKKEMDGMFQYVSKTYHQTSAHYSSLRYIYNFSLPHYAVRFSETEFAQPRHFSDGRFTEKNSCDFQPE